MSDLKNGQQVGVIEETNDRDEREMTAAFAESVYNGTVIRWRYWVEQMPQLSAGEAARLMCALDPDIFKDLGNRPNKNDPEKLCRKAEMIQRLAERQGQLTATPADWLEWAERQGIKVHDGFRMEVESLGIGESGRIEFTSVEAGVSTTKRMTQAEHDEEEREKRERQAKGYYTMSEVAQILADTYSLDAAALLRTMRADYHAGNLTIRARDTEAPVLQNHTLRDFYDWMFPDDIRDMLKRWKWSREFPFVAKVKPTADAASLEPKSSKDWVTDAQSRAYKIIEEQRARDLYPSQENIADQIAKQFRLAGRVGAEGKPISGAYIKRYALKGITSAIGKQLSTSKRQSK